MIGKGRGGIFATHLVGFRIAVLSVILGTLLYVIVLFAHVALMLVAPRDSQAASSSPVTTATTMFDVLRTLILAPWIEGLLFVFLGGFFLENAALFVFMAFAMGLLLHGSFLVALPKALAFAGLALWYLRLRGEARGPLAGYYGVGIAHMAWNGAALVVSMARHASVAGA